MYKVKIEYTMMNGFSGNIDEADTLETAMKLAKDWDASQALPESYVGDITKAFVSDETGDNEWIPTETDQGYVQVKKDGECC